MSWIYKGDILEDIGEYVGFVYIIENLVNHKAYVGKKLFHFIFTDWCLPSSCGKTI